MDYVDRGSSDFSALFKDKKITLMGLGLLGRGVGDAAFLAAAGAQLTVTDLKSEADLASSLERLSPFNNIRFVLGEHRLEDFRKANADMVVKAAGVPMDSPFVLEAERGGVPVVMSTALFAEYTPAQIVGVTGTRGKSTVSYLLYEILKAHAEKTAKGKIFLGGNILGVSTLDLLNHTKSGDVAVLELDSWQLQGFGGSHGRVFPKSPAGFSPHVSVFTTFMPDHMNYYDGDMERYFADKANIYRFQGPGDVLVVSEQVMQYIDTFGPKPAGKVIVARASDVTDSWKINIPGEHNRQNIALAMQTALAMGVPERTIEDAVAKCKAAPGRLEHICTYKGIKIYNDTNSTTPDATIVGLTAVASETSIVDSNTGTVATAAKPKTVLIFGGSNKKLSMTALINVLPQYAKALIVLPGSGTDLIRPELEKISQDAEKKGEPLPIVFVSSMKEAVKEALARAEKGDTVLMSPAFASFGLFKNEYDRGDQFNTAVREL